MAAVTTRMAATDTPYMNTVDVAERWESLMVPA
jgi:hypothetical protein